MKEKIRKHIDNILNTILQKVYVWRSQLNRNNKKSGKYEFLTPNDEAENIEEYSKALGEALESDKVKNIAISGSYGSGKSSFIQTFEKVNQQYNFLDISLAKFKKNEDDNRGGNEGDSDLSLIEKSILEQMFYKVKNKKLPQSRLNKINRPEWMFLKIVFIMLMILSYFVVFPSKSFEGLLISDNLRVVVATIILVMGVYFAIEKLLTIVGNVNIEKLSLQNIELVSDHDNSSLLNKHLDEILYFFEQTKFNVVVFQDLDRFENLEIFTKLRELNNFINNSEQVDKKIVFIYAVKDEMFEDVNERTKFFDFLIPVIPYINATNSYEQLLGYFGRDDIEESFLSDISLYISDMRLLKNIYTEYQIYNATLNKKGANIVLNHTKLLAMIVYKNFEPQDFELLHKSKGLVYNIFAKKNEYVASHIQDIESKIVKIQEKIEEVNNEPEDIKTLRKIYILKIMEGLIGVTDGNLYLDGEGISISNMTTDINFNLMQNSQEIRFQNHYHSNFVKFKDIEGKIGNYSERERGILEKIEGKLVREIQDLKGKQENLKNLEVGEIINKYGDSQVFSNQDIENKKLLKYLISYGHIDKDYEDYISNFFGTSITRKERDFVLNIKNNNKHLPFDFELKNLEEILKKLSGNEFKKESVLNYDLVAYIYKNKRNSGEYNALLQQLLNSSKLSKEFIFDYIKTRENDKYFLESMLIEWSGFWGYLADWEGFDPISRGEIFYQILSVCDKSVIINSNHDDKLRDIMSMFANWNILNGDENILPKFKEIIEKLNVKFGLIDIDKINSELLDYLYNGSYYKLNKRTINYLIQAKFKEIEGEFFAKAHLSTIKKHNLGKMLKYINLNINTYIKDVFLEIESNTQESEEVVVELLNNETLEKNLKEKIIKKQEAKINDIKLINKELWIPLISNNKLQVSWINASLCYDSLRELSGELIKYLDIKENAIKLSETRVGQEYCEQHKGFNQELLRDIIEENGFSLESYGFLIKNIDCEYEDIEVTNLDKDKILLLMQYDILQFNQVCFNALKEHPKALHILLIERYSNKLLEQFEQFKFDTDDIIKIIHSNNITHTIKKELIEKVDYESIINEDTADLIYKYIDKTIPRPLSYTMKILQNLSTLELKINLVVEQKETLNDELVEILKLLPEEYQKIANLDGKQTVLDDNKFNLALCEILKNKNFITKFKIEKNKDKIRLYIKNK